MGDHRAPEIEVTRPSPGPVGPVDTPPTETIAMTSAENDRPRPEPVMNAAKLAGAISGVILSVGALLKLVTPWVPTDYDLRPLADQASNAVLSIGVAWALVGPWITARVKARDKVTPLTDPRDNTGRPLVPVPATGSPALPLPLWEKDTRHG